ncbi:MAG: hypothetical protein MUO82_03615 [Candidatus Thermoplasmatota archaeon]|nr:hypothetical protein [Candidatus Thermoplasmatota archaeon]
MKKQLMIVGIIVILLTVGFSGCTETSETNTNNKNKERILGTWLAYAISGTNESEAGTYTFFSNGTFLISSNRKIWGTYEITDEKFTISAEGDTVNYDYTFSDDGNKVKLKEESWTIILTRQ